MGNRKVLSVGGGDKSCLVLSGRKNGKSGVRRYEAGMGSSNLEMKDFKRLSFNLQRSGGFLLSSSETRVYE